MHVNGIILNGNPFFEAYSQADVLGKFIFIGLYVLSICSWSILLYKIWITHQAKKNASRFQEAFQLHKLSPLSLNCNDISKNKAINPFLDLYQVLKKESLEIFAKNRQLSPLSGEEESKRELTRGSQRQLIPSGTYLSLNDIDYVASHLSTQVARQVKFLEQHLYILSTTVSLAPFLGLLGTIWGILITFSELQTQNGGGAHQMVLGGLSLALATTVLGLLDAIPALIGYNYLKNSIHDFATEMEGFSNEILSSVELQYRKIDS